MAGPPPDISRSRRQTMWPGSARPLGGRLVEVADGRDLDVVPAALPQLLDGDDVPAGDHAAADDGEPELLQGVLPRSGGSYPGWARPAATRGRPRARGQGGASSA